MCGIWAYFVHDAFAPTEYVAHKDAAHSSTHRGPDRTTDVISKDYHFCFHRLAIHDLSVQGDQPFLLMDNNFVHLTFMCNGEIYNYKELYQKNKFTPHSDSDCEIIGHLLQKYNYDLEHVLKDLRGEFAIVARVAFPDGTVKIMGARDPFGVRPLYYGTSSRGVVFSSTLAGISKLGMIGHHLPPGHMYVSGEVKRYYHLSSCIQPKPRDDFMYEKITSALVASVARRLDSERPIGFLLSGGLDSSLVVAIAAKVLGMGKSVRTFSIGMQGSSDLKFARQTADYLGTTHTEVIFTEQEGLAVIPEVTQALETWDITTIRASVGQYLLAKYIKENTNIRVILNGDGADEVECGYLYFYYAPSPEDAHRECIRLLENIHRYDGLRVDRTLAAHGLEARVPFLDPEFVEAYLSVPAALRVPTKMRMEKQFIRDAFSAIYPDILPRSVSYRIKNAFSDAISTQQRPWYATIQEWAQTHHQLTEPEYYARTFSTYFTDPDQKSAILSEYWMPKWTNATDPSARTLSVYTETQ